MRDAQNTPCEHQQYRELRNNPTATTGSDWEYLKTLWHVRTRIMATLYVIGLGFGLDGIITTLSRMFSV